MTGTIKQTEYGWRIYHTSYRYFEEEYEPSIYPIDKDSLEYFNTIENPAGKEVEFKVVHKDKDTGELITDYHSIPIENWTWEAKLIPPQKKPLTITEFIHKIDFQKLRSTLSDAEARRYLKELYEE